VGGGGPGHEIESEESILIEELEFDSRFLKKGCA